MLHTAARGRPAATRGPSGRQAGAVRPRRGAARWPGGARRDRPVRRRAQPGRAQPGCAPAICSD